MPFKMGMILTLNNSINKRPPSRATLQPGYNQTSTSTSTSTSNTSMKQVNRLQTRTNISRANRYSMSSLYSAPRGSGGG